MQAQPKRMKLSDEILSNSNSYSLPAFPTLNNNSSNGNAENTNPNQINSLMNENDDFTSQLMRTISLATNTIHRQPSLNNPILKRSLSVNTGSTNTENSPFIGNYEHIPLDLGLHYRVRFTSENSLDWCNTYNSHSKTKGFSQFLNKFSTTSTQSEKSSATSDFAAEFQSCLYYFVYPAASLAATNPFTVSLLDTLVKSSDDYTAQDKLLLQSYRLRWNEWENSFRSLYQQFIHKSIQYFYFHTYAHTILFIHTPAKSDKNPNSMIDEKQNTGDNSESFRATAIISRTTRAFRQLLVKKGVKFIQPNYKPSSINPNVSSVTNNPNKADLDRLERVKPGSTRIIVPESEKEIDNTLASLIIVNTKRSLHRLFDFLMNSNMNHALTSAAGNNNNNNNNSGKNNTFRIDVPHLYSNHPFLQSCLQSLTVLPAQHVQRLASNNNNGNNSQANSTNNNNNNNSTSYSVDILGPVLPLNNLRLLNLLYQSQSGSIMARYWNEDTEDTQNNSTMNNTSSHSNPNASNYRINSSSNFNSISDFTELNSLVNIPVNSIYSELNRVVVNLSKNTRMNTSKATVLQICPSINKIKYNTSKKYWAIQI